MKKPDRIESWRESSGESETSETSLNRLAASLFAAISVAERQVAVLQDLRSLFMTRGQTNDTEGGYLLWQNPSLKNIALAPIFTKNPDQIWRGTWQLLTRWLERGNPSSRKSSCWWKIWRSGERLYSSNIQTHSKNANDLTAFWLPEIR